MLDTRALGNRIRELRIQRGLTQSAFAEALHVSFQAISNWERGITPPELENLINIAAFFGVMIDDLLRSETENLYLGIGGQRLLYPCFLLFGAWTSVVQLHAKIQLLRSVSERILHLRHARADHERVEPLSV